MAVFQMNLGYPVPIGFLPYFVPEENFWICSTDLKVICNSFFHKIDEKLFLAAYCNINPSA